jgi:hypothetical protein
VVSGQSLAPGIIVPGLPDWQLTIVFEAQTILQSPSLGRKY